MKNSWDECGQCLDAAEKMPRPITAEEALRQRENLAQLHAEHCED